MTTSNDLNVVGHAIYVELIRSDSSSGYCQQLIITPEAKTTDGRVVPMTMYRRRLSTNAPRKTWQQTGSSRTAAFAMETSRSTMATASTVDRAEAVLDDMTGFMSAALKSIASNNYKVREKMIVAEVTSVDMDDIRNGKTPYKLLGRFWKVRKALGFPAEFIPERLHPAHTVL